VQEQVFDLMFALNASNDQLDFKTIYGSAAGSGADESVYPNPVPLGGMVYLREAALVNENRVARYAT
jgi:predicted membrane GTPase involved in stress response